MFRTLLEAVAVISAWAFLLFSLFLCVVYFATVARIALGFG